MRSAVTGHSDRRRPAPGLGPRPGAPSTADRPGSQCPPPPPPRPPAPASDANGRARPRHLCNESVRWASRYGHRSTGRIARPPSTHRRPLAGGGRKVPPKEAATAHRRPERLPVPLPMATFARHFPDHGNHVDRACQGAHRSSCNTCFRSAPRHAMIFRGMVTANAREKDVANGIKAARARSCSVQAVPG